MKKYRPFISFADVSPRMMQRIDWLLRVGGDIEAWLQDIDGRQYHGRDAADAAERLPEQAVAAYGRRRIGGTGDRVVLVPSARIE